MCCHIACGTLIEVGRRCCWERLKKKEKYLKVTEELKKKRRILYGAFRTIKRGNMQGNDIIKRVLKQ